MARRTNYRQLRQNTPEIKSASTNIRQAMALCVCTVAILLGVISVDAIGNNSTYDQQVSAAFDSSGGLLIDLPTRGLNPTTSNPFRLLDGTKVDTDIDLSLPGPVGRLLSFTFPRSYSGKMNASTTYQGARWFGGGLDWFIKANGSNIELYMSAAGMVTFTGPGPTYTAPTNSPWSMVDSGDYIILTNNLNGQIIKFYDFAFSTVALRGKIRETTTLDWEGAGSGWLWYYDPSTYLPLFATAPTGQTNRADFYTSSGKVNTIKVFETTPNPDELIQEVTFTYKNASPHHADLGNTGILVQTKLAQKMTNDQWEYKYHQYRYSADSLKLYLSPEAVEDLIQDNSNIATADDILTKADTYSTGGSLAVSSFANGNYVYYGSDQSTTSVATVWTTENLQTKYGGSALNETGYGSKETVSGTAGVSCCGGGGDGRMSWNVYYMGNAEHSAGNLNSVKTIVVQDFVDSNNVGMRRVVYGLNENGYLLRQATITSPTSSPQYWCQSWVLGTNNLVTEYRTAAAHNITSDTGLTNFLDGHVGTNDFYSLHSTVGAIYLYTNHANGLRTDTKVKEGQNGTANYLSAVDYVGGTNAARKYLTTATYQYPTKTTTRANGIQTSHTYTYWTGTDEIQHIQTTLPVIDSTENGSGVATSTWQYFDTDGRLRWTQDGEGYINYLAYHPQYGSSVYQVTDANPTGLPSAASSNSTKWITPTTAGADTNKPTRSGSLPTAIQAESTTELDTEGRTVKTTDAAGNAHWTVYQDNITYQFPYWNGTQPLLPIQVTKTDAVGRVTETYSLPPSKTSASGGVPLGVTGATQADFITWNTTLYDVTTGQVKEQRAYHSIPSSGVGTLSTNYASTVYKYDAQGRNDITIQVVSGTATSSSVEQVTQQVYDALGRVVETKQGVSATGHDMGASYTTLPTMRRMSWMRYDNGGVGNNFVTASLTYHGTNDTDNTGSRTYYDFLGRARGVEPLSGYNTSTHAYTAQGPFSITDIDWAGRATASASFVTAPTWTSVIASDTYASSTTSNRRSLSQSYYDKLGRSYRTENHNISAADGSSLGKTQQNTYFNRNGQVVATQQAYGAGTETAYDGLGRQFQTRSVVDLEATKYSSGVFNYRDPLPNRSFTSLSGGDDQVLELSHQEFDTAGNAIAQHKVEMVHTDSNGLNMSTSASYIRSTVYSWFDGANRVTAVGNYGTGHASDWVNGTLPTRPGTAPTASSSSVLVTLYGYDASTGRQNEVTDPKGKKVRSYFDAAGRTTYKADNYVDFNATTEANTGGGTNNDQDQVVKTVYNAAGAVTELVALDRTGDGTATTTDNESTKYLYEDTVNASLVTSEIYPDSSDTTNAGSDQVKKTYHLNGQIATKTDQRGVVLTYAYNAFRGLETESVTTVPGGVDSTVRILRRTYDSLRRPLEIQSMDVSANILNEVEYTYVDSIGVARSYQDHDSAVNTGSTPYVEYGYDTSVVSSVYDDGLRPTSFRMPSGNFQYQVYSGTINDALHRVSGIQEDFSTGSSLTVANYAYNGRGRLVEVDYTQPTVKLRRDDDANGSYEALDQFGRIKTQTWKHSGGALMDHVSYQYDYASNRTARDVSSSLYATNNLDQVYGYDSLHRLKNFDEGSMSGSSIASPTKEQDWALDTLGNWNNLTEKTSGSTTLNQNRGHNNANELTTIAGASTYVGHDAAGNMTKVPKPTSWSSAYDLEFDAWNRLVRVKDGGTSVASYSYDGLHRRIVKTVGATTEQHYYNEQWQLLEVRVGTEASAARQKYVWHPYYIDALAQRFWDGNSDGDFLDADEKHFVMHDGNFNVTSVMTTGGTVFERYYYSPYGKLTVLDSNFAVDSDGLSDVANPYTYTGRQYDAESGMYQYRYRYYHAQLGRFVGRDPAGYFDSASFYEYTSASVVNLVDFLGLFETKPYGIVLGDGLENASELGVLNKLDVHIAKNPLLQEGDLGIRSWLGDFSTLHHFADSYVRDVLTPYEQGIYSYVFYVPEAHAQISHAISKISRFKIISEYGFYHGASGGVTGTVLSLHPDFVRNGHNYIHEAVHIQNNVLSRFEPGGSDDEGVAYAAGKVFSDSGLLFQIQRIERELREGNCERARRYWDHLWDKGMTNLLKEKGAVRWNVNEEEKSRQFEPIDFARLETALNFDISCESLQREYSRVFPECKLKCHKKDIIEAFR